MSKVYDPDNRTFSGTEVSDFGKIADFDNQTKQFLASCMDDIEKICDIFKIPSIRGLKKQTGEM